MTSSPTARRPAPAPRALVTHRIAEITTDKLGQRTFRTKGDANEAADPWTFHLPKGEQARVRAGVPYVGFALAALGKRDLRMLIVGLPAGADRPVQPRRPLAGDGRGGRGGAAVKRAALLLALLAAAALSGGVGRSQATFVASSDQAGTTFAASAVFNAVTASLSDPGTPLRSSVPLSATATSDRALVSVTVPALARRRRHVDDDLRADRRAVHVLVGQHRRLRRPLRPARRRARRLGLLEDQHGQRRAASTTPPPPRGHRRDAAHRHAPP